MAKLRITAKRPGFRRAGRVFGVDPVILEEAELTKAQLEAIEKEALLVVERLAETKPPEKGGKGKAEVKAGDDQGDKNAGPKPEEPKADEVKAGKAGGKSAK